MGSHAPADLYDVQARDVLQVFRDSRVPLDGLVDCRIFKDPGGDRRLRFHIGSHPAIMGEIADKPMQLRRVFESLYGAIRVIRSIRGSQQERSRQ